MSPTPQAMATTFLFSVYEFGFLKLFKILPVSGAMQYLSFSV